MLVHDLECPNCGATVEFGSGTRATCAYCHSALALTDGRARLAEAAPHQVPRQTPPLATVAPAQLPYKTPRPLNASRVLRMGCLFVILSQVLFVCVCGGFAVVASTWLLKAWGPLDQVTAIVQQQPQVVQALGQPITLGTPSSSSFQSNDGATTVKFDAPVIGTVARGKVHAEGRWLDAGWDLAIWITYPGEAGERQIYIRRQGVR